jgi:hypothetical protein
MIKKCRGNLLRSKGPMRAWGKGLPRGRHKIIEIISAYKDSDFSMRALHRMMTRKCPLPRPFENGLLFQVLFYIRLFVHGLL